MLLEKLFDSISDFIPGNPLSGKEEAISALNPDKIYVENVRSILGVSYHQALRFCETAVRQGIFTRGIEARCPNDTVGAFADDIKHLPAVVSYWVLDAEGHTEEIEIATDALPKTHFYKLNDAAAARIYR